MSDQVSSGVLADINCSLPQTTFEVIRMGHGSGGKMTSDLIEHVFMPALGNEVLKLSEDAAVVSAGLARLAVTTDSYVVKPIFFPGGDIGSLSVHGTINDLAMRGARPLYMTASFILEEGLSIADLDRVARSMNQACVNSNIKLVAADTKVVNKGAADKIFITTTGVGLIEREPAPGANRARPGDCLVVSGDLGLHGMAVMCAREDLSLEALIESDSAPLYELVSQMLDVSESIHCLRDLTRGGLASVVNELAVASGVGIELEESAIPVHPQVRAACEILGLDPLYVACEGRLLAIVSENVVDRVLSVMQANELGRKSCMIGKVRSDHSGRVVLRSRIGGRRILDKLSGEQLPRIC